MEDKLTALKMHAQRVSLTPSELARGREALSAYMTYRPIRTAAPARSRGSVWFASLGQRASLGIAAMLLFFTMGGAAYAAEGALPGERLYPVKIGFNEELRRFVAWSPRDRALWEGERASRRLMEAEELAREGLLKMEMRVALDARFREHAADAEKLLARVRLATDGEGIAADATARIEGKWSAHRKVIQAIVDQRRGELPEGADTTEDGEFGQIAQLAASVDTEVSSAARWLGESETSASARGDNAWRSLAEGRRDAASYRISSTRSWLASSGKRVSGDLRQQAMTALERADAAVVAGNEALAKNDFNAAFAAFSGAQKTAQEVKTAVSAGSRLKVNVRLFADAVRPEVKADVKADGEAEVDAGKKNDASPAKPSATIPPVRKTVWPKPQPAQTTVPSTPVDSAVPTMPDASVTPSTSVDVIPEATAPAIPSPAIVVPEVPETIVPSVPPVSVPDVIAPVTGGSSSTKPILGGLGL